MAFSPWIGVILVLAAIPVFVSETRFSNDAFRLFRWRAPESRKQSYLETLLAREDNAKEVQLFNLGPAFLGRYRDIFRQLFAEDSQLIRKRGLWGFVLGIVSTLAFYGAYVWIVIATVASRISLGDMTMYLLVFKQAQTAFSASLGSIGGIDEDNLYLSNLYEYLEYQPVQHLGSARLGPNPGDGIRFENVSFSYPGAQRAAVADLDLHIRPGNKLALVGENGAGKTTLIKLLTRLYEPTSGRILIDGLDARDWDVATLRGRVGGFQTSFGISCSQVKTLVPVMLPLSMIANAGRSRRKWAWPKRSLNRSQMVTRRSWGVGSKMAKNFRWGNGKRSLFPGRSCVRTPTSWYLMNLRHRWTPRLRQRSFSDFAYSPKIAWGS